MTDYLQTEESFSAILVSEPKMSGNHLERCLPAEQRSALSKIIQSTSINDLPSEILTKIIKQTLPKDIPDTYNANQEYHSTFGRSFKLGFAHSRPRPREYAIEYRFAILYTNKRLHAVTLHVLQARIFLIKIGEVALTSTNAADKDPDWVWDPVFPGLDLSNIRELVIWIAPSDLWNFWTMAKTASKRLCDQQLIPRGPLKALRIELEDVDESDDWPFWILMPDGDDVSLQTPVAAEDYENVLESFEEIVLSAAHCEIYLPYWMERSSVTKCIIEKWARLGAQTRIMPSPAPECTRDQEIGGRERAEMAPLPDSLLP